MKAAIRLHGSKEVIRAFRSVDTQLARNFGNDLKKTAQPVVDSSKSKISRFAIPLGTIRSRRAGPRVYVEQSAKKTSGLRADFGALQMRVGLIPALEENEDEVFRAVDDVLDHYRNAAGF